MTSGWDEMSIAEKEEEARAICEASQRRKGDYLDAMVAASMVTADSALSIARGTARVLEEAQKLHADQMLRLELVCGPIVAGINAFLQGAGKPCVGEVWRNMHGARFAVLSCEPAPARGWVVRFDILDFHDVSVTPVHTSVLFTEFSPEPR